jgi:hypothetical protein
MALHWAAFAQKPDLRQSPSPGSAVFGGLHDPVAMTVRLHPFDKYWSMRFSWCSCGNEEDKHRRKLNVEC